MFVIAKAKIVNAKKLEAAITNAFKQWADQDINEDHWRYQFLEREWDYDFDKPAIRENREKYPNPITSPRNIEDWGDLYQSGLDSYKFSASTNRAEAYWHWDATNRSGKEYAWYVHEGKWTNRSARPFTDDISIPSSFWQKEPGQLLKMRIQDNLEQLHARSSQ